MNNDKRNGTPPQHCINIRHYPATQLFRLGCELLERMGVKPDQASLVSEVLLHSSLTGHPGQGQGYNKLPREWKRIQAGEVDLSATSEIIRTGGSWLLLDGNNALGPLIATQAMDLAIELAAKSGLGLALVRGGNHLGPAGFYALRAARKGMIGICMSNAGPEMAPWGGTTPVLGTNPWGIGVPTSGDFPLILDIAMTQSGKGMVRWYQKMGCTTIPSNWAYAPDGSTTSDPDLALEGTLVPIGEHKGVGLSFMTDILCGVLTGAAFGSDTYADPSEHNVGYLMWVLNPEPVLGQNLFLRRLATFCSQVKASARKPGVDTLLLPGEQEYRNRLRRLEEGVPLDMETIDNLTQLAQELHVNHPFDDDQAKP